MPWGFFDGAYQGPEMKCGLGFSLYLSLTHYILGNTNIGSGSNNLAEFSTLLALLKLASLQRSTQMSFLWRLQAMHGWMNNETQIQHLNLLQIGQKLHSTARSFEELHFTHIFRELNIEANTLSKEALQLPSNVLVWKEFLEGIFHNLSRGHFLLKTILLILYLLYFLGRCWVIF
jgi:ribonuclease HI